MKLYTLITGASKGIGKAIALEAAARGHHLILVARTESLLKELAADITARHGVEVHTLATDLLAEGSVQRLFADVSARGWHLNMLVNNAGIGHMGHFNAIPYQKHGDTMRLNMDVTVQATYQFLQMPLEGHRRYILNIASTGAYQPLPKMSVYAATKAFVLFFSRAIRHELKGQNVYVTALCPGGTETEFFKPANMEEVAKKNARFMMDAPSVAKAGLNGVMRNKSVVIPGVVNKVGAAFSKVLPHDWIVPAAGNIYEV